MYLLVHLHLFHFYAFAGNYLPKFCVDAVSVSLCLVIYYMFVSTLTYKPLVGISLTCSLGQSWTD